MTAAKRGIGKNIIGIAPDGTILQSSVAYFRSGNSVYDYIRRKYHRAVQNLMVSIRWVRNPVIFKFEVLFNGRYYPRESETYHCHECGGLFCRIRDQDHGGNIVDYSLFAHPSQNQFILNVGGTVLWCAKPELTPGGNPVGINLFDILLKKYRRPVRNAMSRARRAGIAVPVRYAYRLHGEYRYKVGTISPKPNSRYLIDVRRVYHPEE